ncbi:tetratricopeptide repeat protein [Pelagibacterium limicola]|uniref:tetratricopeptide repeat protein n=1 Tax=Pelagibacterium limicola TaxID=2791022 RepID=UPI0018AFA216|nr:tetratricopeptide repeat protein [Pelagibacterium limicola]
MVVAEDPGEADEADVRAALEELLSWGPMRRSPQLSAFLRYVVEATLRAETASIKAYAIAVDVFGRGEGFDPQADPIVRVQARRLRGLIADFYASGSARAAVRIDLPVGSYIPTFAPLDTVPDASRSTEKEEDEVPPPAAPARNIWIFGIVAAGLLLSAVVFWPSLSERTAPSPGRQPAMPLVIVEEFENLASDTLGAPLVAGLALEVVTDFNQFPDVSARYGGAQAEVLPADVAGGRPVYLLSGVARRVPGGIQYGVLVAEGATETALAAVDVTVPLVDGQPTMSLDDISQFIVFRLASPRSILHRPARDWLARESGPVTGLYPCVTLFGLYVERRREADGARTHECARRLADEHPIGRAILASMQAMDAWRIGPDTEEGRNLLAEAEALALAARDAEPTSGFVWAAMGQVAFMRGDLPLARDRFHSALQLNPAGVDIVAGYAQVLARMGNWPAAMRYFEEAQSAEPEPPAWYYLTPALHALRGGDYAQAIAFAERTIGLVPDTSAAILVAAGGAMRDVDTVNAHLPRLLAGQRFRRLGILPALRYQISDPELLRQLSGGMSIAGVPLDRLARPF